jgi:hypothetical protein
MLLSRSDSSPEYSESEALFAANPYSIREVCRTPEEILTAKMEEDSWIPVISLEKGG